MVIFFGDQRVKDPQKANQLKPRGKVTTATSAKRGQVMKLGTM